MGTKKLNIYQERFWREWQLDKYSDKYNICSIYNISGTLDIEKLVDAINALIDDYAVFRFNFTESAGKVFYVDNKRTDSAVDYIDLSTIKKEKRNAAKRKLVAQHICNPFDLRVFPLYRNCLLKLAPDRYTLILCFHHILVDGYTMKAIKEIISAKYNNTQCAIEYKDISLEGLRSLGSDTRSKQYTHGVEYWSEQLTNAKLHFDFKLQVSKHSIKGKYRYLSLSKKQTQQFKQWCNKLDTTPFCALLSIYSLLLSRYFCEENFAVLYSVNMRNKSCKSMLGAFVNNVPFVFRAKLIQRSFQKIINAITDQRALDKVHQKVSLADVVEKVRATNNISSTDLFNASIDAGYLRIDALQLHGLSVQAEKLMQQDIIGDLNLSYEFVQERLVLRLHYLIAKFSAKFAARFLDAFARLFDQVITNTTQKLASFKILTAADWQKFVIANNSNIKKYPKNLALHQLFEQQVLLTPNNIALKDDNQELSYAELNMQANKIARFLRNQGVKSNSIVGVYLPRSVNILLAVLGILKAGGSFLPLDTNYPLGRLKYMMHDSKVDFLITELQLSGKSHELSDKILLVDQRESYKNFSSSNLDVQIADNDLAYVIYTSGSTGLPKGVMISHANIVDRIHSLFETYKIDAKTRQLFISTFSFDASLEDLFLPISRGGMLIVPPFGSHIDMGILAQLIHKHQITCLNFVPSVLELFLDEIEHNKRYHFCSSVRVVFVGGEKLSVEIVKRYHKNLSATLINLYGPTENTIDSTYYYIDPKRHYDVIPIGKPLPNSSIYVLDAKQRIAPIGVPAELYLGGIGVSPGYLNRSKLTAEKFIQNPFCETDEKLYRTGDAVSFLEDGNLTFVSRLDNQVKLRGIRIETGEIEAVLRKIASIKQAAVAIKELHNEKQLIAYFVAKSKVVVIDKLRKKLMQQLPTYMIPAFFVELQKMPLMPSGKIDKRALPDPEAGKLFVAEYVAPRNEIEQKIADIWSQVLHIKSISVNANFFHLGGFSLNAIKVISRINYVFHVDIVARTIFDNPTIVELCQIVEEQLTVTQLIREPIKPAPRDKPFLLSSAEQRLWFLNQYEVSEPANYNIQLAMKLAGKLDVAALEKSVNYLIKRHEAFHTIFPDVGGEAKRVILPIQKVKLIPEVTTKPEQAIYQAGRYHFDLAKEPLLRVKLFKTAKDKYILFINQHHIISDGWSVEIFIKELSAAYTAFANKRIPKLPKLTIQYADYANWQRKYLTDKHLSKQIVYWKKQLAGYEDSNLPTDFPRPLEKAYHGKHYSFLINKTLTQQIKYLSRETGTTVFMVLLTAFKVLLYRYSGQEDILLGSPIANRRTPEVESIIGFFVNTLALRTDLSGNPSFEDLLAQVKQTCLEAYANQDMPFEKLVEILKVKRDVSRSPIFQLMFILQTSETQGLVRFPQVTTEHLAFDYGLAKFDILTELVEVKDGLLCTFEYNTDLFAPATIIKMAKHYQMLLRAIVKNSQENISSLPMLMPAERNKLLSWNNTARKFSSSRTLQEFFVDQVNKTSDHIAVVCGGDKLTYKQLNQQANQVAHIIKQNYNNLQSNSLIAISVEPCIEMIVGILGILKAGAGYVPLDPDYPEGRLTAMLKDSAVKLLLSQQRIVKNIASFRKFTGKIIYLDDPDGTIAKVSKANPKIINSADDTAYVIYTSGSTGIPKGILLPHTTITNLVNWQARSDKHKHNRITQFINFGFDVSLQEIFYSLLKGHELHVIPKTMKVELDKFLTYLRQHQITTVYLPTAALEPLAMQALMAEIKLLDLRQIIVAGEALKITPKIRQFFTENSQIELINNYGPSETHVVTSYQLLGKPINWDDFPAIGKAIDNTKLYIFDKNLQLVPIGVPGELYVAGIGVAHGYLNRPELTKGKFIANPLNSNETVYKTGDLVRRLQSGDLEFLGRSDNQVKIRGFRIELGEIETVLSQHPNIKQVVSHVYEEQREKHLIAYYVAEHNQDIRTKQLNNFLTLKLPSYMIPCFYIKLHSVPLTPNGKVDYAKLPEPKLEQLVTYQQYVAPRTETEKILVDIWRKVLNFSGKIGIHDSFFEIGGHSILTVKMLVMVQEKFKVNVSIAHIFRSPTIAALAEYIDKSNHPYLKNTNIDFALRDVHKPVDLYRNYIGEPKKILLTGVTGFLGSYLLTELLSQTDAQIYCLIRGKDQADIENRFKRTLKFYGIKNLIDESRIKLIKGDLEQEHLGLSKVFVTKLCNEFDHICHNGAFVHHMYGYRMLRAANVLSTIELLKIAAKGKRKVLSFISTIATASCYDKSGKIIEAEFKAYPPTANGYVLSKWTAEKILKAVKGEDINIFRPGYIMGHSKTGVIKPENNHALALLKSCVELGVAPDWKIPIEMTPVDILSKAIVKLSLQNLRGGERDYNMYNPYSISWIDYINLVKNIGLKIEIVPEEVWKNEYLRDIDEANALYALREFYLQQDSKEAEVARPLLQSNAAEVQRILQKNDIYYPTDYEALLKIYIKYLQDTRFLPTP